MLLPNIGQVINAYKKNNYKLFDGFEGSNNFKPYDLNIFGIRSSNLDQSKDVFQDLIGILYYQNQSSVALKLWQGTTSPGKYYLENPMNPEGTFILIPGQYLSVYKIGKHHEQDALIQVGNLRGYRDTNRDDKLDVTPQIFEGNNFGVNIHHKEVDSETIGLGSAGCQVFKYTHDHSEFMQLCYSAVPIWGNSFSYTLFQEKDIF